MYLKVNFITLNNKDECYFNFFFYFFVVVILYFCLNSASITVDPVVATTFHYRQINQEAKCKTVNSSGIKDFTLSRKVKLIEKNIRRHFNALNL